MNRCTCGRFTARRRCRWCEPRIVRAVRGWVDRRRERRSIARIERNIGELFMQTEGEST